MQKESVTSKTPTLSIQLRKLPTDFFTRKIGDVPIDVGMSFDSVEKILKTPWQELYKKVELHDTKDLMFTLGLNPEDATDRTWVAQKVLLFDIDNANFNDAVKYAEIFSRITGLARNMFSQQWTGGGFHFLISLKTPIDTKEFFKEWRVHYQIILEKLNTACKEANLSGTWDPDVFKPNIMSRLPGSINSKYQGEIARVRLIQDSLVQCDFDLARVAGIPKTDPKDSLPQKELAFYKLDTESIKQGCLFLNHAKQNARTLSEPEWYATLTILSKLPDGKTLSHEYSRPHPNYSEQNTNAKLDYIQRANIGPRTCSSISSMWTGCNDCKYYQKVKSPVQIKGDRFIATRDTGFSIPNPKNGSFTYQHKDLLLHFEEEQPFVYTPEKREDGLHIWLGTHWKEKNKYELLEYAQRKFKPFTTTSTTTEFWNLLTRTNVRRYGEFFDNENLQGKINLQNGIYDVDNDILIPHSQDYGFQTTLNYPYDPTAKINLFEKFINDVACGEVGIKNILQEWFGYTLSGCAPHAQKMLLATGQGENGKSSLFQILAKLLGTDKLKTTSFEDLKHKNTIADMFDQTMLYFDEIPEMGKSGKSTWEFLKSLSAGTYVTGSEKYEKSFTYFFKAKIILNCNILPTKGTDASHGFFRRLLIVPFNAKFTKEDGTKDSTIVHKIKESELPGILNWAVEGYKRLKANDWNFSNSETVNNAISDFKTSSDTIGSFVNDWLAAGVQTSPMGVGLTCELDGKLWVNLNQLYIKYKEEQLEGNRGVHSFDAFMTRLKAVLAERLKGVWVKVPNTDKKYELILGASKSSGPENKNLITLDRRRVDGKRCFVLWGVTLLSAGGKEIC